MNANLPSPNPILDLISAFRKTKILYAAVSLGLFDLLETENLSSIDLATRLNLDHDALERLVAALAHLKLLEKDESGAWQNAAAASTYLTVQSPHRLTGYINYSNIALWKLWEHLEDALREGTHRWQQTFGWDQPIFSNFFKTDTQKNEFLMGMHGYGMISSPIVGRCFDLSPFDRIVDLGGATGHLIQAICEAFPQVKGVLFDLPEVLPLAREVIQQSSVSHRITLIGGDFFIDPLPPADLYTLGRIIHDWDRPKIMTLLKRIYDNLDPGGGLLIAEKVLFEDKTGPEWAVLQSLNMLVCTEGKERSFSEYCELLNEVGFHTIELVRTSSPLDGILALK